MADELGYFTDECIEPIFEFGGPNVPHPTQILAGGAADVGFGNLNMIAESVNEGEDFVILGTRLQQGILGISSLPANPIYTAADICGKKIGATPGDIIPLDALLLQNGLEPGCYEMVPVGWDPSPVAEGLVDGMVNYMNSHPVVLDGMGIENIAVSYAEMGQQVYDDIVFTSRDFLDNNREAVVGMMRALVKGWEATFADPETAMDVMYNGSPNLGGGVDVGMDISYQIYIHYAQVPLMESDLTATDGLFTLDYDLMTGPMWDVLELSGVDPLPDPALMIDTSVLDEAFGDCRPSLLDCSN
jgi:ABC-type nitrate/sulfonate/bicarbonate transport system substrate-binding protein